MVSMSLSLGCTVVSADDVNVSVFGMFCGFTDGVIVSVFGIPCGLS